MTIQIAHNQNFQMRGIKERTRETYSIYGDCVRDEDNEVAGNFGV